MNEFGEGDNGDMGQFHDYPNPPEDGTLDNGWADHPSTDHLNPNATETTTMLMDGKLLGYGDWLQIEKAG